MPLDLTRTQEEALRSLLWLHNSRARQEGRSTVQALAFLVAVAVHTDREERRGQPFLLYSDHYMYEGLDSPLSLSHHRNTLENVAAHLGVLDLFEIGIFRGGVRASLTRTPSNRDMASLLGHEWMRMAPLPISRTPDGTGAYASSWAPTPNERQRAREDREALQHAQAIQRDREATLRQINTVLTVDTLLAQGFSVHGLTELSSEPSPITLSQPLQEEMQRNLSEASKELIPDNQPTTLWETLQKED